MASPPSQASLYDLLRVPRTATQPELRRAYLGLARVVHPDKNPGDAGAKANFQALRRAYEVLSNPVTRERYDRTGVVDGDDGSAAFEEAYERFRGVRVTEQDIEAALKSFRGSPEEEKDLIEVFLMRKGDVTDALAFVVGSTDEDVPRFVEFWAEALKSGRLPKSMRKAFDASKGKIRSLKELDEMAEDLSLIHI